MKIFILALFLFIAGCGGQGAGASMLSPLTIETASGARHDFRVELAITPEQQQKGLMNRTQMDADRGMLFFFGDEAPRSFWMKNTLIPLDIIFIAKGGVILNIHENAVPHDLTSIKSNGPAIAALELNGGTASRLGLKAGDRIIHTLFPK
jgi:hypothetical protein